jgi:hypothetical protein
MTPKLKLLGNRNFGFSLLVNFALGVFDSYKTLCRHGLVVLSISLIQFSTFDKLL